MEINQFMCLPVATEKTIAILEMTSQRMSKQFIAFESLKELEEFLDQLAHDHDLVFCSSDSKFDDLLVCAGWTREQIENDSDPSVEDGIGFLDTSAGRIVFDPLKIWDKCDFEFNLDNVFYKITFRENSK